MAGLRDVEIRHLLALRAVAREHSFGRAAQTLGYTQSAVSQQIAALERLVGGPVFDRPGGPKPVELTPLGRLLLGHAEALLDRLGGAEEELAAFTAGLSGVLSVGTYQSVSVRVLPHIVRQFRSDRAGVDLRLYESDEQDELLERLRAGLLDVSFLIEHDGFDDLAVERLFDDPFVLLSPPDDDVGAPGTPTLDMALLPGLPMIGEYDSACQRQLEGGLRRAGIDLSIVFRSNDNAAIQAMVRAGIGHAVMPALAVDADDPDVVIRRIDPGIPPRTIALAWQRDRTLSPAVHAFIDIARQIGRRMAERQGLLDAVS
jgi:DNA-binding transcriptional LysR family regulator